MKIIISIIQQNKQNVILFVFFFFISINSDNNFKKLRILEGAWLLKEVKSLDTNMNYLATIQQMEDTCNQFLRFGSDSIKHDYIIVSSAESIDDDYYRSKQTYFIASWRYSANDTIIKIYADKKDSDNNPVLSSVYKYRIENDTLKIIIWHVKTWLERIYIPFYGNLPGDDEVCEDEIRRSSSNKIK